MPSHAWWVQSLAISGCVGATDELFTCVNKSQRAVLLHNLSAKHIKGLQACWLGLRPTNPAHLGVPDSPLACWQPAESAFAGGLLLIQGLGLGAQGQGFLLRVIFRDWPVWRGSSATFGRGQVS